MKAYVVTETWCNHGEYEDYRYNWNGFISVYLTLDKAIEGIKKLILSDENFNSSKLDPPFNKIDFAPACQGTDDKGITYYDMPELYYNGGWDMEQYDVTYSIHEVKME